MKRNVLILVVLLLVIQSARCENYNEDKNKSEKEYYQLLENSLSKLNNIADGNKLTDAINELKRLDNLYPGNWLSDYYVAYFQIKLAFYSEMKKDTIFKDIIDRIEKMERDLKANQSEVYTLKGYYYYALIAQNPAVNGQKYYKEVFAAYQKATVLNDANPRPALLLCIFKNNMAAMTGSSQVGMNDELEKIEKMFETFTPENSLEPNWGLKQLKQVQTKYNTNK